MVNLVEGNISYTFCHVHILPVCIIEGAVFAEILRVPSKNQIRQILFITKKKKMLQKLPSTTFTIRNQDLNKFSAVKILFYPNYLVCKILRKKTAFLVTYKICQS